LDFGDYSDQYYSVQTTEGEQIAQLIAGYIDIILKKKQAKDHLGIEGDEGSTLVEESISPFRATIVQRQNPAKPTPVVQDSVAKPAVMHAGPEGINSISSGHMASAQYSITQQRVDVAHSPQPSTQHIHTSETHSNSYKALMSGREAVKRSEEYLSQPYNLPPLGSDPVSHYRLHYNRVTNYC
jgi:talin